SEAIGCRPGDILWLPLLDDLEEDFDIDNDYADYEELMFGRPVLILCVDAANTVATFCTVNFLDPTVDIPPTNDHQITSFGGYGLMGSQYAEDYDREFFIPISPAPAHPDHDPITTSRSRFERETLRWK
ncbi:hypothetical protein LTS18_007627, partial [Coniosporium uncinatum]